MINKSKVKQVIKIAVLVLAIMCLICLLQIPQVIHCEILTAKYGHIFEDPKVYRTCSWIGDDFELKVLEYSSQYAVVYYIDKYVSKSGDEFNVGTTVRYRTNFNGDWSCVGDSTVWSDSGSAEGTVMPYWWH